MADVPALLFEYQILARAWWQLTKPDEPTDDDELAEAQEDNQPKQQVIVVGEDIVTFAHQSATAAAAAAAAAATTSPPAALAPLRVGKYHAAAPSAPPATFVIRERDGRAPDSQLREVGGISACAAGDVARAMALAEAGWVASVRARLRVRVYPSPVP